MNTTLEVGTLSRFTDDYLFFEPEPTGPPPTLNILLSHLGVSFAPADEQQAAITGWLRTNRPGPRLATKIRNLGIAITHP